MAANDVQEVAVKRRPREARPDRWQVVQGMSLVVVLLLGWQILGSDGSVSFPRPSTWLTAMEVLYRDHELISNTMWTLSTFALSLVLATALGTLLGLAIGGSARLERALRPFLEFMRATPAAAVIPAAVLLFGPTRSMAVGIVVFSIIWPILLNVTTSRREIHPVRIEMSVALGVSRFDQFRKIVFPSVLPGMFLGVKIATSISLVVTLLVDILASNSGLGRLIVERQQAFDSPSVYALLLVIATLGFLLNAGVNGSERVLFRNWPSSVVDSR